MLSTSRALTTRTCPASDGWKAINLAGLRDILVARQIQTRPKSGAAFSDPAGVELVDTDERPESGHTIAWVRDDEAHSLARRIAPLFHEAMSDSLDSPEVLR